jgi:hypothetical protein
MSENTFPYFHIGQGVTPSDPTAPKSAWAMFATNAKSLQYDDLKDLHWSWNLKDYVMESHPDRIRQFYAGLHGITSNQEYDERTYCVRYVQKGTGCPLKSIFLTRVNGKMDTIREVAGQSWQEVFSTFPYDYVLYPINSELEFIEETGQVWLNDKNSQISIVNFHPSIGLINGFQGSKSKSIALPSSWNATATSAENIWRALHNYPYPVMLDILLKPTFLRSDELMTLDLILSQLKESVNENDNHPVIKIQSQQWLEAISQQVHNIAPLYVVQVRLVSPQEIYPYLIRIVGTALTYRGIANQDEPYQSYQAQLSDSSKTLDWAHKIATLELIDFNMPTHPPLKKLAITVPATELPYVAPFFLTPKGGISNLQLETL